MLKRVVALVCPPSLTMPDIATGSRGGPVDVAAERERLRQAIVAVTQAEQKLEEAKAHTQRVLDVINAVEPLEAEAKRAADAAAEATRKWAVSGASNDVPCGDQDLISQAAGAQRRLTEARLMAPGAEAALSGLQQAEREANFLLSQEREEVARAAASVMFAMLTPQLAELREAKARYLQSLTEMAALSRLWSPEVRHWYKFVSSKHYETLNQQLRELEIRIPSHDELGDGVNEWKEFAKRLTSDPDAAMSDGIEGAPHEF